MKRKILVLLLAMTLALSLMPMMAFADNETEDPASVVNETEMDSEEILFPKAKIERIIRGNTSALKSKNTAVLKAPKICTHPSTDYYYDYNEDYCKFKDRGDYHEVTGDDITKVKYCLNCGDDLEWEELGDGATVRERHEFEYGVCLYCEHPNTCSHPSTYYSYDYSEDEDCEIIDRGDYHEVRGWIYQETRCETCEDLLDEEAFEYMTLDENHSYNSGGACEECGHLNDESRLYGSTRYDTAVTVANRYKKLSGSEKFANVIVANGQNYPDALSGGYLAKVKNAPILLVDASVEDYIVNYIDENIADGGKVYILGGTGVVRPTFENKIKAKGIDPPIRLGGADRYETNLKILKEAGVKDEDLLVCSTAGYADSLSASAVGKPILLVGTTLTDTQKDYIRSLGTEKIYLIGGTGAVSDKIETELGGLGYDLERLWGPTRFETSTAVAKKFFPEAETVVLTYAHNFPDGLSGGPLAMRVDAPIILVDSYNTKAAKEYVASAGAKNNFTLGGPLLLSDIVVEAIMGY